MSVRQIGICLIKDNCFFLPLFIFWELSNPNYKIQIDRFNGTTVFNQNGSIADFFNYTLKLVAAIKCVNKALLIDKFFASSIISVLSSIFPFLIIFLATTAFRLRNMINMIIQRMIIGMYVDGFNLSPPNSYLSVGLLYHKIQPKSIYLINKN